MSFKLNNPSILAIRKSFIVEKLGSLSKTISHIDIFVTGRTTSGKTTLGNRLIGEEYFLCLGYQNTTKEINLVEFPSGLRYFDLPGVDSDDRLENYNRATLGLEQVENFPFVKELTLARYRENQPPQKQNYSLADFKNLQLKPDLIFYLIAPNKQFSRGEEEYLWDLLKYHQQVIYVFNMFVDRQTMSSHIVTPQNFADVESIVTEIHKDALGNNNQPIIVKVNCLTGEGISELLTRSHQVLGDEKGKLFKELIHYQQQKTPDEYVHQVKRELLKVFAHAACQKPDGNSSSGQTIREDCQSLWNFLVDLLEWHLKIPYLNFERVKQKQEFLDKHDDVLFEKAISHLVSEVMNQCIENHYEKVTVQKSKPIYQPVPKYKTVYEQMPDYNRPIKQERVGYRNPDDLFEGLGNFFQYERWKTRYSYYVTVGYHKKTVSRQVFDGYKDEYSHTEYWIEETGKRRKVGSTYYYLRQNGVTLLLALTHLITSGKLDECKSERDVEAEYRSLYCSISKRVNNLGLFPSNPTEGEVVRLLESKINLLFEASFDEAIRKVAL